jgi:hypothetical protein
MNKNSISNFGKFNHNSCPRCGSTSFQSGAGLKPGQESRKCSDCGEFLGYLPVKRLKRLRKQRNLTDCLNLLESCKISSETAQLFVLDEVGAIGGGK